VCVRTDVGGVRSLLFWGVTELRFVVADVSERSVGPGIPLRPDRFSRNVGNYAA